MIFEIKEKRSLNKMEDIFLLRNQDFIVINSLLANWDTFDSIMKDRFNELISKREWNNKDISYIKDLFTPDNAIGLDYIFLIQNKHPEYIKLFGSEIHPRSILDKHKFYELLDPDSKFSKVIKDRMETINSLKVSGKSIHTGLQTCK